MTPPEELGDRTTHRVADHRGTVDSDGPQQGCSVVGAVLQPEPTPVTQAVGAVAVVVPGDDPEALGQRRVHTTPVEVGADGPAVEQQHDRGIDDTARGRSRITDPQRTPTWKVDDPPRRQPFGDGRWEVAGHGAHPARK